MIFSEEIQSLFRYELEDCSRVEPVCTISKDEVKFEFCKFSLVLHPNESWTLIKRTK